MNKSVIRYILGGVLKIESVLMLLPCVVAIIYKEMEGFAYLAISSVTMFLGILMSWKKPKDFMFYLKEGCIATSLSWILMSFFGAIPFVITGEIPHIVDALFETISGFTTTGASILNDVESLSYASLMWRSFSHWIGGMGVLVFLMAVIPLTGGSNINLMRAESPGPSVGKLVPKMKHTARLLYIIYFGLTLIEMILLLAGDMPLFDSMATAFGTAGTGGFGIKNNSIAGYSPYIQWVVTIFMILFGVNFNAYYFIVLKQLKKAFTVEEVRCYFAIIAVAVGVIFFNILDTCNGVEEALRQSSFQVASLISSTGFSTVDYNVWNEASKAMILLVMLVGACAGSTGGGIKVSRIMVLFKTIGKELNSYIYPRRVKKIKIEKKPVEREVVRSINVYFITFMVIMASSIFILSFEGKDFTTNFSAVLATLNNIGPGLNQVGPAANFSHFSDLSKFVMMYDMLAGRLEIFPMLILFHPSVIKEMFRLKKVRGSKNDTGYKS